MDVGASTGGFTDCMLQNGAVKVYSVDVGHGQLAWKLRNDERVVCMEKTNIRYVLPGDIGDRIMFASIDVSFISLTKVLGPVKNLLAEDGQIVCLIKPQFEAGRETVSYTHLGNETADRNHTRTGAGGRGHGTDGAGFRGPDQEYHRSRRRGGAGGHHGHPHHQTDGPDGPVPVRGSGDAARM